MSSLLARQTSHHYKSRYKPRRNAAIAALDIGSSGLSCLIAAPEDVSEDGLIRIRGTGNQSSMGSQYSTSMQMENLEMAIRLAVQQAEQAASTQVDDVVIGISGSELLSTMLSAELPLQGREITAQHMRETINASLHGFTNSEHEIMHASLIGFGVDNSFGIRDPRGMCANRLSVAVMAASAPVSTLRNILHCVSRAHLKPLAAVAAPYASGLACLVPDELEGGAVLLDLGASFTGMAVFRDSALIWLGSIPFGGTHASADLAQGLGTTFAAAERLKTLNGAAALSQVDPFEIMEVARLGTDGQLEASRIARGELTGMLRPRIEEIFEMADNRLAEAGIRSMPRRIVLTGGASSLPGIREVAEDVFNSPVRLARSLRTKGAGEAYDSPAFSAVAGLLCHQFGLIGSDAVPCAERNRNMMRRALDWLRDNF